MAKKKKHGWVFALKGLPVYAMNWGPVSVRIMSNTLNRAVWVCTRAHGRRVKHPDEVLRKVSMDEFVRPMKIIPGR